MSNSSPPPRDHAEGPCSEEQPIWQRLQSQMRSLQLGSDASRDQSAQAKRLARRAQLLREQTPGPSQRAAGRLYLAIDGAHGRYGIPLSDILEVQTLEHFTPVPRCPDFVSGVLLWRGVILTLLDLGKLLGAPQNGIADYHSAVIVQAGSVRVDLIAREVESIMAIAAEEIQPMPAMQQTIPEDWLEGIVGNDRLLVRLDRILTDPRMTQWRAA